MAAEVGAGKGWGGAIMAVKVHPRSSATSPGQGVGGSRGRKAKAPSPQATDGTDGRWGIEGIRGERSPPPRSPRIITLILCSHDNNSNDNATIKGMGRKSARRRSAESIHGT